MDFRGIVKDISKRTQDLIDEILAMNISPSKKEDYIEQILLSIAEEFGDKLFSDISYMMDSESIRSTVQVNLNNQVRDLSKKITRNYAFDLTSALIVKEYYDVILARAEEGAFRNARSLQRHPTLTRSMEGEETCDWCRGMVGTFVDPDPELYARHDGCDCKIVVSGYKKRNGVVENYTKASRDSIFKDSDGNRVTWNERLRRIESGESSYNFTLVKE